MTIKRGYALKVGDKAHFLIATQLFTTFTEDLTRKSPERILPGDVKGFKKLRDGLYRITASIVYARQTDQYLWGTDSIKPMETAAEIKRLEEVLAVPVKYWSTDIPGTSGEMEKEARAGRLASAKRRQSERLLYHLKKLVGATPNRRRR